jgi:competence protein ComEC
LSIITGERSLLTKETRDAFNVTGLAHILSISGAHFGLLLFILFKLFRFSIKALPYTLFVRLTLYLTPSQIAAILCIPFMIGYLGISDMSTPSIRAFIMITLFLFGLLIHRKGFWINTLLLAAVIIILIQPDFITELSFQLSFIAVLCIGLTTEQKGAIAEEQKNNSSAIKQQSDNLKRNYLHNVTSSLLLFCSSAMKISLAATIGTAPLVAYHFHYLSLISPVANLIITPIIGFIILPLSLMSSFVFLVSGFFPLHSLVDTITVFVLDVIKHIGRWSFVDIKIAAFPPILLAAFYSGILIYVVMKLRAVEQQSSSAAGQDPSMFPIEAGIKGRLLRYCSNSLLLSASIAIIPMIIYTGVKLFEHRGLHITYLDIGQGDSAVIELPDNKTIVIDTGRKGFQTAEFLKYRGVRVIDAIILSHGSSDHTGGVWHLMKNFKINEIWDNGMLVYPEELPENTKQKILRRGDVIEGNGYKIFVLHPYDGFYTMKSKGGENNDSLVIKIQGVNKSFLFTGDIEEEAQEDLSHLGDYLKSNVLKVPHHGSRTSHSETFLDVVSPDIAVISVGRKNIYGHPHVEVLDMLRNLKVFRTDRDGAVGIRELADGRIAVKTWNKFRLAEAANIGDEFLNFKKLFSVW